MAIVNFTNYTIWIIAFSSILLIFASCGGGKQADEISEVEMETLAGETITLADQKGKVIFLNFWATWCGPCRMEIPDLNELYNEYQQEGFLVIGVSVDNGGFSVVGPYAEREGIDYPLVMDDYDLAGKLGGVPALPTTFFINREGTIAGKEVGYFTREAMERRLEELL